VLYELKKGMRSNIRPRASKLTENGNDILHEEQGIKKQQQPHNCQLGLVTRTKHSPLSVILKRLIPETKHNVNEYKILSDL
jgi:hypothetical protein